MSRSDKDPESRTVANSPLQQSSFVFFPEEETIRKQLLKDPDLTLQAAGKALEDQQKKIEERKTFVKTCFQAAAKAAKDLSDAAISFAQTLPQSLFGVGEGEAFLLPLDRLFERMRAGEVVFDRLILRLDPFWQPDAFDLSRFAFLESVLPQANMAKKAEQVAKKGETIQTAAKELSRGIDLFLQTVVRPFVNRAAEAADLENNGNQMRFGKLCTLCGELESAAERFAKEWNEQAEKIGSI